MKNALDPYQVVKTRNVVGGPSPEVVKDAILNLRDFVKEESK